MKQTQIQQLKDLKKKFREQQPKKRENLGVCFLKLKLGVHNEKEKQVVLNFLADFRMTLTEDNLDAVMNYLHSEDHSLPEFIAMEESLHDADAIGRLSAYSKEEVDTLKNSKPKLPEYKEEDLETLRDPIAPFGES
ncbi:MAG: hypothetical protein H7A33_04430 [Deltaproteobacteria bacterium]|nr:hypothetical protein [Deltaproteobacteria bacterium]